MVNRLNMDDAFETVWEGYRNACFDNLPTRTLREISRVAVIHEGDVTELPGMTCFPDTKAPILGALQEALPPILTT
ncbi:hypothetical protein MPTK1_6g12930 [Marchantia polymorpha subsp. ruderalis]|uniref:Phospholipase D C-terminal domain-containing protein n=2 Tax=Marchantia polymorpha TaxID=3197 RepID=A0AAF6BRG8_MARPO|nr:hypothetical protein MARPO_0059s0055 [Marchantia polymorpha]BBN14602.1 hypothetical protein Mp_6g12930 [Marchantia polymorpha subsp. ruderalis]|eukprot:PTQ37119.1 hypothetical protein MARPO_0059s0055 [Marchantia polymorpha]